jgi:hypothetical protein
MKSWRNKWVISMNRLPAKWYYNVTFSYTMSSYGISKIFMHFSHWLPWKNICLKYYKRFVVAFTIADILEDHKWSMAKILWKTKSYFIGWGNLIKKITCSWKLQGDLNFFFDHPESEVNLHRHEPCSCHNTCIAEKLLTWH